MVLIQCHNDYFTRLRSICSVDGTNRERDLHSLGMERSDDASEI